MEGSHIAVLLKQRDALQERRRQYEGRASHYHAVSESANAAAVRSNARTVQLVQQSTLAAEKEEILKMKNQRLQGALEFLCHALLPPDCRHLKLPKGTENLTWLLPEPHAKEDLNLLAYTSRQPNGKHGAIVRCGCVKSSCQRVFVCLPSQTMWHTYTQKKGPYKGYPKVPAFCPTCHQAGFTLAGDRQFKRHRERMELLKGFTDEGSVLSKLQQDAYWIIDRMLMTQHGPVD